MVWSKNKLEAVRLMEVKLRNIMNWLTDSGMKVNEAKTDLCLFHKGDTSPVSLNINGNILKSNNKINTLGVIFDSKLQWQTKFP